MCFFLRKEHQGGGMGASQGTFLVIAIFDLVHDLEAAFYLPYLLTGSWKSFLKYE